MENNAQKHYTCCSLNCPLIPHCKHYNFTVDRGDHCEIYDDIVDRIWKHNQDTFIHRTCKAKVSR